MSNWLFVDAHAALTGVPPTRKERDKELTDQVMQTLRKGGNVLLPVDTSGS